MSAINLYTKNWRLARWCWVWSLQLLDMIHSNGEHCSNIRLFPRILTLGVYHKCVRNPKYVFIRELGVTNHPNTSDNYLIGIALSGTNCVVVGRQPLTDYRSQAINKAIA